MKDKIKFEFSESEKDIIINSLNLLRNYLQSQDRSTDSVDEILLTLSDKHKVELDIFDSKIIINALNNLRYKLKNQNEPRSEVNNILLKMIDETDKKKVPIRIHKKDNESRRY